MRRLILAGTALLVVPALALAGVTVTQGKNTLKVRANFDPAQASKSKNRLRAIKVKYDYWAGTTNDTRLPDLRSVKVFMGGARFGFGAFATCDETDARTNGKGACPDGSRVGRGTAVAEVHPPDSPTTKTDVETDVVLYNGELDTDRDGNPMDPRPGLLVYTEVGGTPVALGFWSERRKRQLSYYNPEDDAEPNSEGLFAIKEIHLTIRRQSRMRGGRRIPFVAAPTRCDRRWTVSTTNEPYKGQPVTARHRVRCTDA